MIERRPADSDQFLSACDREPIHAIGQIQPFGCLIGLTDEWRVSRVSANIEQHSGLAPQSWLDRPLDELISRQAVHKLRNIVSKLHDDDSTERGFGLSLIDGRRPFDIAAHCSPGVIILEAEPATIDERDPTGLVRAIIARLRHSENVGALISDGARHVQALTGFDRVMVYRFGSSGDGEVVAEALRGNRESYLGLHYPASDIPRQARALYLRNTFRIVADVMAAPVAIIGDGDPLDQSMSVLRAVSPVHIEYLRNMAVAASLSISIVVDGKLWGLFACHHFTPRLPSFAYRTAAELFGQMFSMMLEGRERRDAADQDMRSRAVVDLLKVELQHNPAVLSDAKRLGELLFDVVAADGIGLSTDGSMWFSGEAPDPDSFSHIIDDLAANHPRDLSVVGEVAQSSAVDASGERRGGAAGFLAIPLLRRSRDHIVLFRSERTRLVSWAGQPGKHSEASTGRLMPRTSFAAWVEQVRGQCEPFTTKDMRAAEMIRIALLENMARGTLPETIQQGDKHDLLVAELNHRVRNILSLIRGLISQTRDGAETAESFVATLDDRVQALARAHDQVTLFRWGPARLIDLIETEAGAYLGPQHDRIRIEGPAVSLQPAAFTTLSLVFHELMTNAVKYGGLSDRGRVSVRIIREPDENGVDGDLLIGWSEEDGPPVAPPVRRGFGSTIIERSIPYDLGGEAMLDYQPSGFQARFRIPARHLAPIEPDENRPPKPLAITANARPLAGRTVLLVEDSMIIAMDCEDVLRSLGATHVATAANVRHALREMADKRFDFALLDYSLGEETSIAVADALAAAGIPFAFATGYDGQIQNRGHANAPVLGKPYGVAQLVPLLATLGFGAEPHQS